MDKFSVLLGSTSAECVGILLNSRSKRRRYVVFREELIAEGDGFVEVTGLRPAACGAESVDKRFLSQVLLSTRFAQGVLGQRQALTARLDSEFLREVFRNVQRDTHLAALVCNTHTP